MPRIIYCIFFLFVYFGYTQENLQKYREDQIYFSVYYNSLGNNLDNFKEAVKIVAESRHLQLEGLEELFNLKGVM